MANGDVVKLGTLYMGSTKVARPTMPWQNNATPTGASGNGNITNYTAGATLTIGNTDASDTYKMQFIEVNVGTKKMYVCDRNMLVNISWDDLNAQGLVSGKSVTIDGTNYNLRLLTGGGNYRNSKDAYAGGTSPQENEWDRVIINEGNYSGLPVPTSTDLDSTQNGTDLNGTHNQKWNWYYCYSWCQETYLPNIACRLLRGCNSARYYSNGDSTGRHAHVGFRPVLEMLNSALLISDSNRNLGNYAAPVTQSYTVSDPDGQSFTLVERLNGNIIRTLNNQTNGSYTLDLSSQWASLAKATHTVTITATDSQGASTVRTWTFTKTNQAPAPPTILYPTNTQRCPASFYVEFTQNADAENDNQYFSLEIANNSTFTSGLITVSTGLQRLSGSTWVSASYGTSANNGARFRLQASGLPLNQMRYIRIASKDTNGSNSSSYSDVIAVKIGNILSFNTVPAVRIDRPEAVSIQLGAVIDASATLKIEVANNASDATPTWEDATAAYQSKQSYTFVNALKTASTWAVAMKITITANNATGEISVFATALGVR